MKNLIKILLLAFLVGCSVEPKDDFLSGYWGNDQTVNSLEFYFHLSQEGHKVSGSGIWSGEIILSDLQGQYLNNELSLNFNMPYTNQGFVYWALSARWYEADNCFRGELIGNFAGGSMKYIVKLRRSTREYLFKKHSQGSGQ